MIKCPLYKTLDEGGRSQENQLGVWGSDQGTNDRNLNWDPGSEYGQK